jgi:hypothetical protein
MLLNLTSQKSVRSYAFLIIFVTFGFKLCCVVSTQLYSIHSIQLFYTGLIAEYHVILYRQCEHISTTTVELDWSSSDVFIECRIILVPSNFHSRKFFLLYISTLPILPPEIHSREAIFCSTLQSSLLFMLKTLHFSCSLSNYAMLCVFLSQ